VVNASAISSSADMEAAGDRRSVTVLGATGSVGESTLDLLGRDPERFAVVALTANRNVARLAELARLHRPRIAVIGEAECYGALKDALAGEGIEVAAGPDAVIEAATRPADICMAAIVGAAGLAPTFAAISPGRIVALANKECLVSAGAVFMDAVTAAGATLLPVDSEHSAAFQSMAGGADGVEKLTLVDGTQDHHRFGDADEQGPRADRGAPPVRSCAGPARRRHPPAIGRSLSRALLRRIGARADELSGHARADRL
jgi:hypothetical protein